MKEHAKKALKHDFEVAGKTIPTLAVALLFLVGTGSAALLSSFGTVSGTADVEQAIVVDGSSDKTQLGFFGASYGNSADVTAGTVSVDTFTIENNMNSSYSPTFTSYDATDTDSDSVSSSTQFKWANSGIRTSFVEYYPEAGHNFDGYTVPSADITVNDDGSADADSINQGIAKATAGDVIVVKDGTYKNWITVNKSLTIVSKDPRGAEAGRFTIRASDVVIQGFDITSDGANYNGVSVEPENGATENITIKDNYIHDIKDSDTDKHHAFGVLAWNYNEPNNLVSGLVIKNNKFSNIGSEANDAQGYGVAVEDLADQTDALVVEDNTFSDIKSTEIDGKNYPGVAVAVLPELTDTTASVDDDQGVLSDNANALVSGNDFNSNDVDVSVAGDVSGFEATENSFGSGIDVLAEGKADNGESNFGLREVSTGTSDVVTNGPADATENFFSQGTWSSVENGNIVGDVDASYQQVGSISSDSTETVAAVNEFALMLDGSQDYSLTTTIQ
jgi:hypothetical protein